MPPSRSVFLVSALIATGVIYIYLMSNQVHYMSGTINRQFREMRMLQNTYIQHDKNPSLNTMAENNNRLLRQMLENQTFSQYHQHQQLMETKKIDDFEGDETKLEWLDRSGAKEHQMITDGTCHGNSKRDLFKVVLQEWTKMAQRLEIRYFMDYGALLGVWRDEDVIPWDHDIDIRIHVDDFLKLLPLRETRPRWNPNDQEFHVYVTTDWRLPHHMRRKFNCLGQTVDHYVDQCSFTHPYARLIKGHAHVDIFVYTTYHDTVKYMPSSGPEFLKGDIFPLVKCNMMDLIVRCPRNSKVILENLYDDNILPRDKCEKGVWNRNPKYFEREAELQAKKPKHDPYRFV